MKYLLFLCFFMNSLFIKRSLSETAKNANYKVQTDGNFVKVIAPRGKVNLISDIGFSKLRSYEAEISINEINEIIQDNKFGTSQVGTDFLNSSSNKLDGKSENKAMSNDNAWLAEANRYYNEGNFKESLKVVEGVLKTSPNQIRALTMKGSLLHVLGQKSEAIQAWKKVLTIEPTNEQIKNILKANGEINE